MTPRGTFIINGVERVVVSQLIRSSGVYFTANLWRGRKLFGAKVIPNHGAWLEFETESDGFIGVRIDRKRKAPATELLRIFGIVIEELEPDLLKSLQATIKKDPAKNADEAYLEIYRRI